MQKNAKFSSAGGSALLAPPIANFSPHLRISGCAPGSIFDEDLFFDLHLNSGEKSVPYLVKTFYFALHLICSPEKNGGRGLSPPMLKIGKNWGKIANYPPNAQQKFAPLVAHRQNSTQCNRHL